MSDIVNALLMVAVAVVAVGCNAAPTDPVDAPSQDAASNDGSVMDMSTQQDLPPPAFVFQLGSGDPFVPWTDGGELPFFAGFQGGWHTEHTAMLRGITFEELDQSTFRVSVERGDSSLAEGGWLYERSEFDQSEDGWTTYLPPVIFEDEPVVGDQVVLVGEAALADGRTEQFRVNATLVEAE